ncbi:MAG: hypothetical protein MUE30_02430 [Spirosomaceae bacterium]|jgi:hypothetical protein|nr:hypothetical protein [Spirosomataceae bacterium]
MRTLLFLLFFGLEPPVEYGTLTIYRRRDYFDEGFVVKINKVLVSKSFSNNELIVVEVPVGKAIIETSGGYITDKQTYTITVKANETIYLKGVVDYDYFSNTLYLKRIAPNKALPELTKLSQNAQLVKKVE